MPYISQKTVDAVLNCSIKQLAERLGYSVNRDRKILSPFKTENTPSCLLNKDDKTFHCFATDSHGNAISLYQAITPTTYPEAIEGIANIFNIAIEYDNDSDNATKPKDYTDKKKLIAVADAAASIYQSALSDATAQKYMEKRGIDVVQASRFGIGYSNGTMPSQMPQSINDLKALGIINDKGNDVFYKRLIFPIHNYAGKVVGFTARALDDEQKPKYINSRQSDIFNKSAVLYGLHLVAKKIKETGFATIVEGCTDAIALDRDKEEWNAVSTLSKRFSDEQAKLLKNVGCNTLNIFYDNDEAGHLGTENAISTCLRSDIMPYVIALNERIDPDTWVCRRSQNEHLGCEKIDGVVWIATVYLSDKENLPFEYDKGLNKVCEVLAASKNPTIRDMYIGRIAKMFKIDRKVFNSKFKLLLKVDETENKKEAQTKKTYADARNYIRVGTDYFKKVWKVDKYGAYQELLVKWNESIIKSDYVDKGLVHFLDYIAKYDDFGMLPDFVNYRQAISIQHKDVSSVLYNLCHPLPFTPQKGEFPTIKAFLSQLFGDEQKQTDATADFDADNNCFFTPQTNPELIGNPVIIAMDYYRIKLQRPTQILPVICLVSSEQETGKSTLLKFNTKLFGSNACIIGKEHLESQFNGTYANKIMIGVDEAFIGIEKKSAKERIKKLATDETIIYNQKGIEAKEIPYYGSLVFCSNDEKDFMQIQSTDKRFWIIKVKPPKKKDPDLLSKMIAEMPAFIHYCLNTPIFHPKVTRSWFDDKLLHTEQRDEVAKFTRNTQEAAIQDFICNLFFTYRVSTIKIGLESLETELNKTVRFNITKKQIGDFLSKQGFKMGNPTTEKYPTAFNQFFDDDKLLYKQENLSFCPPKTVRLYTFNMFDAYWRDTLYLLDREYFMLLSKSNWSSETSPAATEHEETVPF